MRKISPLLVAVALLAGALSPVAVLAGEVVSASLIQEAPRPPDVKIDVETDEGGAAWYTNPLWIAIGALALLLVIVLVVAASRGGGTTVIRD